MTPTVLTDVSRNDPIWTDEIFVTWSANPGTDHCGCGDQAM